VIAHSDKEKATPTWKKTFGFHPLVCFLDRPAISSGEALAGIVREGRAGSNTTAEHIAVLDMALAGMPPFCQHGLTWPPQRPEPDRPSRRGGRQGPRLNAPTQARRLRPFYGWLTLGSRGGGRSGFVYHP
jgi:hypothetical protein